MDRSLHRRREARDRVFHRRVGREEIDDRPAGLGQLALGGERRRSRRFEVDVLSDIWGD